MIKKEKKKEEEKKWGGVPQKVAAYQRTVQTGAVSDSNITVSRKKLIIYFCNNFLNSDNNDNPYDSDSILEVSALS